MITVKYVKVNEYEYEGVVNADELSPREQDLLGVKPGEEVEVGGEFRVTFDDDIAMVEIETCIVIGNQVVTSKGDYYTPHFDLEDVDLDRLATDIEQYAGQTGEYLEWLRDYEASMVDYAMDAVQNR